METNSQINVLEAQIRECFGRVVWTHKTQEKCADILNSRNSTIKLIQIILSAITTSGIIAIIFDEKNIIIKVLTALISLILLIFNTYLKKYDLGQIAQKHAECASNLWNVRENYFSLLTDIRAGNIKTEEIVIKRDLLQNELHNIYKGAPRTISKAYNDATKALKENEEMTFSDEEIDKFLPKELKKIKTI